jgi:hypothetical protein
MPISSLNSTNKNPGSAFIVATGGQITEYSSGGINYKVHKFTGLDNFQVLSGSGTLDYLIVAGGGGGGGQTTGSYYAGGGGAGGLLQGSISTSVGVYPVSVGAGGSAGVSSTLATNGSNTIALGLTAVGGGYGGRGGNSNNTGGGAGGSGGGNGENAVTNVPGAGIPGQGYPGGGYPGTSSVYSSGGGATGSPSGFGALLGGPGLTTSISGTSTTYSTGGRCAFAPTNASSQTGDGGGGALTLASGGSGGSGIVILRYRIA